MSLSLPLALATILAMGLVTLACRAAPFLLFGSGKIPPLLDYLQRSMPPIIMTVLVFNAYKALFPQAPSWAPALPISGSLALLVPGLVAAALQAWKRNALLSIAGATALHMLMTRLP